MTKNILGTIERPRISIFRSNRFVYGQVINDEKGITMTTFSTKKIEKGTPVEKAKEAGKALGEILKSKKITAIVFDRNGLRYHGQVAAFADGVREVGIKF